MNRKLYPADWRQRRLRILARDRYRCVFCGVMDRKHIIRVGENYIYADTGAEHNSAGRHIRTHQYGEHMEYGTPILVVITIMHLDHDEWNHDVPDNRLASACQRCHLAYDKHDNAQRKIYGKQYKRFQLELF